MQATLQYPNSCVQLPATLNGGMATYDPAALVRESSPIAAVLEHGIVSTFMANSVERGSTDLEPNVEHIKSHYDLSKTCPTISSSSGSTRR